MKKNYRKFLISFILIIIMVCSFAACGEVQHNKNIIQNKALASAVTDENIEVEDSYFTIYFNIDGDKRSITKGEIINLKNKVIYDKDNPVYAGDKTDDFDNKIPHTLKGVLLNNVVNYLYKKEIDLYSFDYIGFEALDNYSSGFKKEEYKVLKEAKGELIIAYEYDGKPLITNLEKNIGGLKMVVPNQANNSWVKNLNVITMTSEVQNARAPKSIYFLENMYRNQSIKNNLIYEKTVTGPYGGVYQGFDMQKLKDQGYIGKFTQAYIEGWDRTENNVEAFWEVYKANRAQSYIENSAIILNNPYYFPYYADRDLKLFGMNVKKFVFANVDETCFMSLDKARIKFDVATEDANRIYKFSEFSKIINFQESDNYQIKLQDNTVINCTSAELDIDNIEIKYNPNNENKFEFNCPINGEMVTLDIIGIKGINK